MYYTYAFLRDNGTPYYIGKGKGYRITQKSGRPVNPPKDRNKIIFLKKCLTEKEAFRHEIYMISVFGRKDLNTGILYNRTNGGEGCSGAILSGDKNPFFGKKHTEESKIKISKSKIGKKQTEQQKQAASKRSKKLWEDGIFGTLEHRKKISKSLCKNYYQLTDKNGVVFYTNNIKIFSEEHGLDYSAMYKVVNQKLKSYKGWKGRILKHWNDIPSTDTSVTHCS